MHYYMTDHAVTLENVHAFKFVDILILYIPTVLESTALYKHYYCFNVTTILHGIQRKM